MAGAVRLTSSTTPGTITKNGQRMSPRIEAGLLGDKEDAAQHDQQHPERGRAAAVETGVIARRVAWSRRGLARIGHAGILARSRQSE